MRRRDVSEKGLCQCTLQIWWSLISKMWEIRWVLSMDLWRSAALTAGAGKEISDVQVLYRESKLGKADKGAFLFPPLPCFVLFVTGILMFLQQCLTKWFQTELTSCFACLYPF